MYLSFYNLSKKPFTISADPRFLWQGEKHKEAFANLKYGLLDLNGYVVLTGDVGTGKTTLLNALIETLDDSVHIANVNHPILDALDFFRIIANFYDPSVEITNKAGFLLFLNYFLQKSYAEGKVVLLIIDEAHRLSKELLEEIRLFSNIEQAGTKLINIFFVGQNEFNEIIQLPECRALRQRITLFYDLKPLTENETKEYVEHRLRVAGAKRELFTSEAVRRIHRFTRGYPRLINILCDRALLTGYVRKQRTIDTAILKESSGDLQFHHMSKKTQSPEKVERRTLMPMGLTGLVALILIGVGMSMNYKSSLVGYDVSAKPDTVASEQQKDPSVRRPPETLPQPPESIVQSVSKKNDVETMENVVKPPEQKTANVAISPAGGKQKSQVLALSGEVQAKASQKQPQSTTIDTVNQPAQQTSAPSPQPFKNREHSVPKKKVEESMENETKTPEQETAKAVVRPWEEEHNLSTPELPGKVLVKASQKQPQLTTFDLAAAAIEQENFLLAIDLLESHDKDSVGNDSSVNELYAKALVGRAEQIGISPGAEVEALLQKAVEVNQNSIDAHFDLGKLYTQSKNYTLAIVSYQNAIKLDPGLTDAFFNLGYIYATTGRYLEAEEYFMRVVQLAPEYLDKALVNLALIQEKLGKREESLENLHKAVIRNPGNEKAQNYLKKLLASMEVNQQ